MSGVNAPYGLKAKRYLNGAPWNGQQSSTNYIIASGYGTSLFTGDPVTIVGGFVTLYTPASGATVPIQGVFNGCFYYDAQGKPVPINYWAANTAAPAGTTIYANIIDDPMVLFSVQTTSSTGLLATSIMKNVQLSAGTGSTNTGLSGYAITGTPLIATPTADCKIYGLDGSQPNGWTTTGPSAISYPYNNILVKLNNHVFSNGTDGSAS